MAQDEEEGADKEEGREEGASGSAGTTSEGSTCGYFVASCPTLRRIDSFLMAPMT